MPYSKHVIERVNTLPAPPCAKLARWAVYLDIPVTHIAFASGATRQTVYGWFRGGQVAAFYVPVVLRLVKCMQGSKTGEEAWDKICQEFNLQL